MDQTSITADTSMDAIPTTITSEVAQGNVKAAMKTVGATSGDLWRVPMADLHVMPGLNVRGDTEAYRAHIEALARSIFEEGFYPDKALAVFVGEDGKVYVRDGHSRLKAAQRAVEMGAQLPTLPCVTAPKGSTMEDFVVGLVKSNSGLALRPIEVAVVCKRLSGWGWDSAAIAKRLDYSTAYVDELLSLLAAPKALVELVEAGKVSASTAVSAVKDMGAAQATEAIVKASKASKKGGKVVASDIGQSKAQKAVKAAAKKAPKAAPAKVGDPIKALELVFNDKAFNLMGNDAQQAVLAILNP